MRCPLLSSICAAAVVLVVLPSIRAVAAADQPAPKVEQSDGRAGPGRQVFMQARCFACHGEYGFGGVGPRFRENRFLGMGDYVIGQILIGRGVMPSFAEALDNKQIADVASYIRNSWGNNFGPVKPDEVAKVRQAVTLHPPQGRPHLPPQSSGQNAGPVPPDKPLPPGRALPPDQTK